MMESAIAVGLFSESGKIAGLVRFLTPDQSYTC